MVVVVHGTLEIAKKANFNISLLQIRAKRCHKLENFFFTNWGNCYYKIGATSFYYKMGQALLQIGTASVFYKLGQVLLQIGAAFTNWGKFITNWGSLIITNQGSYYKLGQPSLQIGANFITN